MKIITIAFIFQFLLSCWPKVDITVGIHPQTGEKQLSAKIGKLCAAFEKMGFEKPDFKLVSVTGKERQKQQ